MELLSVINLLLFLPLVYLVLVAILTRGLSFALPSELHLPPITPILFRSPATTKKTPHSAAEDEEDTKVECSPLILPEMPEWGRKTEDRTVAVSSPLADLRQRPAGAGASRGLDRQNSDVNRRVSDVRHSE
jgi:hypothetical protein